MNGRSLHRPLRNVSIQIDITVADMAHPTCPVCGKRLPDDPTGHRKYCSGMCQARASRARTGKLPKGRPRKLTDVQRAEIRALRQTGLTHKAIAARFGVSKRTVEHLVNYGVVDTRS